MPRGVWPDPDDKAKRKRASEEDWERRLEKKHGLRDQYIQECVEWVNEFNDYLDKTFGALNETCDLRLDAVPPGLYCDFDAGGEGDLDRA